MTNRRWPCATFIALAAAFLAAGPAQAGSLRFFGNGVNDIDRVKIRIDPPGPPADVGANDFTIEFWLRSDPTVNPAPPISCGGNNDWILGNIVFDRDRYNQGRAFGISLGAGRVAFGTLIGTSRTICGTTDLRDGAWHHIAVQRRVATGQMSLYVDGVLEAQANGAAGDISYPDNAVPGNFCNGPCTNDPFIVLGAEKHDAGSQYPSFNGWLDEVRISTVLRYSGAFTPSSVSFTPDANTAALYHFDEPSGTDIIDSSPGNASPGIMNVGGSPAGPLRSSETPFSAAPPVGSLQFSVDTYTVAESVPSVTLTVQRVGGSAGPVSVDYGTGAGSASAGSDYTTALGTLSWNDAETTPKTFVVAINDDSVYEGDETFGVSLSNPTGGATLGARATATVTIVDNETPPAPGALEFTSGNYSAGESDGTVTVTVRRISGSDGTVGVSYATSGGTATAGMDYQSASGALTWGNGDAASKTFAVTIVGDTAVEGQETVLLALSSPTGAATLGALPTAQLTILDDDSAPAGGGGGGGGGGAFGWTELAALLALWGIGKSGRTPGGTRLSHSLRRNG